MGNELLLKVADVLDKAAKCIEDDEKAKKDKKETEEKEEAQKVADSLTTVMGEPVPDLLVDKIAKADPAIQELLSKVSVGDTVDSLGGPEDSTKTASVSSDGMGSAETNLLTFLTS